jgi:hypothetical protein
LLRALEANEAPGPELEPYLERAQARLAEVSDYSVDKLTTELELKRLWLEERALETRRAELRTLMRDATDADSVQVLATLDAIRRRMGEIGERRSMLQLGRRPVEAA